MSKIEIVQDLSAFLADDELKTAAAKDAAILVDTHAHIEVDRFDEDRE